ncbi:zinc finger protein 1 homolog isoform X2 [Nilaparvata lugens]|uniref:zinc finger protein 1 homolog isoform X2 n=1 Tax=Nilaparvata lugens TaxID=108931 RepID=UPI00193D6127|nr:zinc finger protein 1 homolog isoform X2 [Nilaparvata lugens]
MDLEGEECGSHSGSSPIQMQPDYLDGQGQDNSRSMPHSQHQGPDMDNCNWPIHEPDQHQDTIEDKYHIQLNVDNQSVYLDHNYSKHPIEIIRIKPEELIEEDEEEKEEEEQQQCGVDIGVRSGEIKQESDTCLQIERTYSLSSDRLNSDLSVIEKIKFETGEIKEEQQSFETDHSDALMQIEGFSSDQVSENYESENVSSGLCIPYYEEREGSSSDRSVDATPGNFMMKDSEKNCNEVDLHIENARKNVIDSELTKCQLCDEAFSSTRELNLHCRIHTAGKHACKFCNYKTKRKSQLIIHLRTHTAERPFSCDLCDYKATKKSNLISHLKLHKGERPFSCDSCDYKATQKSNLIRHLKLHKGDRPFSCDLCDYKATHKSNLIRHLKSHTGERPFSCDLCDYKAIHKSMLISHIRSHTGERPFSCEYCDYKATQKSTLIHHLMSHTGERPFSCDLCDYKATRKSTLIRHLMTHTGERPFSCNLCDYKTTRKSILIRHSKSHTGQKCLLR